MRGLKVCKVSCVYLQERWLRSTSMRRKWHTWRWSLSSESLISVTPSYVCMKCSQMVMCCLLEYSISRSVCMSVKLIDWRTSWEVILMMYIVCMKMSKDGIWSVRELTKPSMCGAPTNHTAVWRPYTLWDHRYKLCNDSTTTSSRWLATKPRTSYCSHWKTSSCIHDMLYPAFTHSVISSWAVMIGQQFWPPLVTSTS